MVEGKRNNNSKRFVQKEQTHSVFYHKKNRLHYNKRARKCEKNLPNALEMAELQQGSKLYGSFLFRMKIQDLLESFQVDPMIDSQLQCSLRQIKACLDHLTPKKINNSFSSEYPFMNFVKTPSSMKKYNYSFQFQKPTNCHLVGSYLLKTIVPFHKNIDMCVEMPSEMFRNNDYLNYR
jgi:U3 small nucleolar RNA-associated protein 22